MALIRSSSVWLVRSVKALVWRRRSGAESGRFAGSGMPEAAEWAVVMANILGGLTVELSRQA
jgi:hypothetical protein